MLSIHNVSLFDTFLWQLKTMKRNWKLTRLNSFSLFLVVLSTFFAATIVLKFSCNHFAYYCSISIKMTFTILLFLKNISNNALYVFKWKYLLREKTAYFLWITIVIVVVKTHVMFIFDHAIYFLSNWCPWAIYIPFLRTKIKCKI